MYNVSQYEVWEKSEWDIEAARQAQTLQDSVLGFGVRD